MLRSARAMPLSSDGGAGFREMMLLPHTSYARAYEGLRAGR